MTSPRIFLDVKPLGRLSAKFPGRTVGGIEASKYAGEGCYTRSKTVSTTPVGSTLMRKILSVYMRSRNSGWWTQLEVQVRPSRRLNPSLS